MSPRLAARLRELGIDAESMQASREGQLLNALDSQVLEAAAEEQQVLVTADQRSIPRTLAAWAQQDRRHGGIIFIDESDTKRTQISSVADRLSLLLDSLSDVDWTDRIAYLPAR